MMGTAVSAPARLAHGQTNRFHETEGGPSMKTDGERFTGSAKAKIPAEPESTAVNPIDSESAIRARAVSPSDVLPVEVQIHPQLLFLDQISFFPKSHAQLY
jgi:hypothetical protein